MQEARAAPFPSAGSAHLRGPSKIPRFFPGATRSPHTHLQAMFPSHANTGLSLPLNHVSRWHLLLPRCLPSSDTLCEICIFKKEV